MAPENDIHQQYMMKAFALAEQAKAEDEVPIGAIVVCNNKIIGKGYNQTEKLKDPTAHAEMIAITAACNSLNSKYLHDCTLYVTLEPCVMCAGALRWSQISQIVYAAKDPKGGYSLISSSLLHPKTIVQQGVCAGACEKLLKDFFAEKRK